MHWRLDKNRGPPPANSFAAKHLGQRLVIEEIARSGPPAALTRIERRRRHGEMDVRVEVEPARPVRGTATARAPPLSCRLLRQRA